MLQNRNDSDIDFRLKIIYNIGKRIKMPVIYNNERDDCDMKCPYCGYSDGKVIDSRSTDDGTAIRRRRECMKCQRRFTTYETLEAVSFAVIKADKSRQPYDRTKILRGIMRACEKRPVSLAQMEKIADDIESELYQAMEKEVTSLEIGERVMKHLKAIDEVAYVRFASVHKHFSDVETFMTELKKLIDEK